MTNLNAFFNHLLEFYCVALPVVRLCCSLCSCLELTSEGTFLCTIAFTIRHSFPAKEKLNDEETAPMHSPSVVCKCLLPHVALRALDFEFYEPGNPRGSHLTRTVGHPPGLGGSVQEHLRQDAAAGRRIRGEQRGRGPAGRAILPHRLHRGTQGPRLRVREVQRRQR